MKVGDTVKVIGTEGCPAPLRDGRKWMVGKIGKVRTVGKKACLIEFPDLPAGAGLWAIGEEDLEVITKEGGEQNGAG